MSLQVQRCRGYAIGEHYALPVEVGEGCSLLDVCHNGRIVHPETAVGPAATAPIRQHGEEGFFVDGVLTLAETLRAAFVSRAEAVVRIDAQTIFPYPELPSSFIVSAMIALSGSASPARRAVETDSPKCRKHGFGSYSTTWYT